ncbi:hypothetical protein [Streptomyces sp. NPDC001508]|uniref:hypothetical protein n=1 Tax=Streptomyces sp. NPDC001508 TaxID=3154656 RepID=UPI0033331BC5
MSGDGHDDLVSSGSRLRIVPDDTAGLAARGTVTVAPPARGTTRVLAVGDFHGDGRADLALRTYRGETKDTITVYRGPEGAWSSRSRRSPSPPRSS